MINATTRERRFEKRLHTRFDSGYIFKRVSTLGKDDRHSLCLGGRNIHKFEYIISKPVYLAHIQACQEACIVFFFFFIPVFLYIHPEHPKRVGGKSSNDGDCHITTIFYPEHAHGKLFESNLIRRAFSAPSRSSNMRIGDWWNVLFFLLSLVFREWLQITTRQSLTCLNGSWKVLFKFSSATMTANHKI